MTCQRGVFLAGKPRNYRGKMMRKLYNSMAQSLSVLAIALVCATGAMASSHTSAISISEKLRLQNPGIDPIITGTNNGSLKLENLPAATIDKGDCPLCYHRELMKKNLGNGPAGNSQPFPSE